MDLYGRRCDSAVSNAQCQAIQTGTGVTGGSILLELHKLCKFHPVKDMVTDKMHLSFNMLKKKLLEKMWADQVDNSGTPTEEHDPNTGGLLTRTDLKENLKKCHGPNSSEQVVLLR